MPFSAELEQWLADEEPKTLGDLTEVFGDRGIAVAVLLLMSPAALPLPTGGLTHVFEAVTVLLGLEMVLGRSRLWLPRRLRRRPLGQALTNRVLPFLLARIGWYERRSRHRLRRLFHRRWATRALGVLLVALALAAAVAPPFSGLDTLPALGAVLVALAILLQDATLLVAGFLVGIVGVALIVSIGAAVVHLVGELF